MTRYRRPHVLHVELDELVLNAADLGLELAWCVRVGVRGCASSAVMGRKGLWPFLRNRPSVVLCMLKRFFLTSLLVCLAHGQAQNRN